jgi:hypothetical protein
MSKLGDDLLKSLEEALVHAEGKQTRARKVVLKPTDIQKARKKQSLSRN